jgi:hypothetical protein
MQERLEQAGTTATLRRVKQDLLSLSSMPLYGKLVLPRI